MFCTVFYDYCNTLSLFWKNVYISPGHTNNLERLFYSNQLRIGKAVLPQANVRSRLWDLDATVLQAVQAKLQRNQRDIKNSTAYVMAVIFNTICEAQSDLLVDPYLNGLNGPDG